MLNQLKDCITTLPISPIANPNIGLIVLPFLMDVLGKKMNLNKVLSFNVKGEKLYNKQIEDNFPDYLLLCKNLGIHPDFLWRDDQEENIFWVNNFFHQLRKNGYVVKEKTDIMKCLCGAVESLSNAENLSPRRRIYRDENGRKYCNLCNSEIINSRESVFLFCFPSFGKIKIFPEFYAKELSKIAEKFSGFKFLISRSRPSALALQIDGEKFFWILILFGRCFCHY